MKSNKTVKELAEHVGGPVEGDESLVITGASTLREAGEGEVSFLANDRYEKEFLSTKASAVVVGEDAPQSSTTLIRCSDPYFAFMQIVVLLHGFREHEKPGISAKASVAPSAVIGENVHIHDYACIARDACIGDNTIIYPNSYVGAGTRIGKGCLLYPNVTVYEGCMLGDRVTLHAGCVIGQDGFGFATHEGVHHKIPQVGGVIIEDDVEMGANCAVDRATLGNTVIGKGTKMSDLVAIGHGTQVGPYCLIVAQVGIAGSVKVGRGCTFGGQAGTQGHISIGDGARIGGQSAVLKSVEGGKAYWGTPAWPATQTKRALVALRHLPELSRKISKMEEELARLKSK